jgi:mannose-6-phosphate isomerase-like protein (cupin superfamily)
MMPASFIVPFSSAPRVPFRFEGRILYVSDGYELIHLTLQPGEEMAMLTQPMDVVFFVVEGTGTLKYGDESTVAGENTTIKVGSGVNRAWSNTGKGPLRVLVNKLLNNE